MNKPTPQPTAPPTRPGPVVVIAQPETVWGRLQVVLLCSAVMVCAYDHVSSFILAVNDKPTIMLVISVFPPIIGSLKWPLIAICCTLGRRRKWLCFAAISLMLMYFSNAAYWLIAYPNELTRFVKEINRGGAFMFWSCAHLLMHAWLVCLSAGAIVGVCRSGNRV